jgi:hypothetical protein
MRACASVALEPGREVSRNVGTFVLKLRLNDGNFTKELGIHESKPW